MTRSANYSDGPLTRELHLDLREEDGEIWAALSSEQPVQRLFGKEVLDHSPGAVDVAALGERGLPLLVQHDHYDKLPVGRAVDLRIDADRVMRGRLTFSKRAEAQELRQDVIDGVITDVSVGYTVERGTVKIEKDVHRFMKWKPHEASLVSIGADSRVGINRGSNMDPNPAPAQPATPPEPAPESHELEIRRAFDPFMQRAGVAELLSTCIREKLAPMQAQTRLLNLIGTAGAPEPSSAAEPVVEGGEDEHEKWIRAATNAIAVRAGVGDDEDKELAKANPYTSFSMVEIARRHLELNGVDVAGMNRSQIIVRAIDPGTANLDTSDFPRILENVMNKALFTGFNEADVTWDIWCGVGSVVDFKPYTRPGISEFDSLAAVTENAAITDGTRTDKKEGRAARHLREKAQPDP